MGQGRSTLATCVVVPVSAHVRSAAALACLGRLLRFTAPEHRVIALCCGSPRAAEDLRRHMASPGEVGYADGRLEIRVADREWVPAALNALVEDTPHGDVVVVRPDALVSDGWLDRMVRHAQTSDLVATVSAMTDDRSLVGVRQGDAWLGTLDVDRLDAINIRLGGLQTDLPLPPATLPVAMGPCILFTRRALVALGSVEPVFDPSLEWRGGAEVDASIRAVERGLIHVMATDVLVHSDGDLGNPNRDATVAMVPADEAELERRYPGWRAHLQTDGVAVETITTAFRRVILQQRPWRLLIDARELGHKRAGPAVVMLESVHRLADRLGADRVTMVVHESALGVAQHRCPGIRVVTPAQVNDMTWRNQRFDAVFRPFQVNTVFELADLFRWAERAAVLQLDFIGLDSWRHFGDAVARAEAIRATKLSALCADAILYNSDFVQREAQRIAQRIPRSCDRPMLGNGVDHEVALPAHGDPSSEASRTVLVLGTSYAYKNRSYAVHLAERMTAAGHPPCRFVMVGREPHRGGSGELDRRGAASAATDSTFEIHDWLTEEELSRLPPFDVLLYPTLSEGFGLPPFEAAHRGIAPLFAPHTSMRDTLPTPPYALSLDDPDRDAATLAALLDDPAARRAQIDYVLECAGSWRWDSVIDDLLSSLEQMLMLPPAMDPSIRHGLLRSGALRPGPGWKLRIRRLEWSQRVVPPGRRRTRVISSMVALARRRQ